MKTKLSIFGFLSVFLIIGLLIVGCPGDEGWGEDAADASLSDVRIAGVTASLGTPATSSTGAKQGSITLDSKESDESGNPTIAITSANFRVRAKETDATIKYSLTDSSTAPGTFASANPKSLTNGQFLWIEVTSGKSVLYYVIRIIVKGEFSIVHHPSSRNYITGADIEPLTVVMSSQNEEFTFQWYSNTVHSNKGGTAISGATSSEYKPTLTSDGKYTFYVTIKYGTDTLTSSPAMIEISAQAIQAPTAFKIGANRMNYIRGIGGTGSFMFREGSNADASPDADVQYIDLLMGVLGSNILRIMVQDDYENYMENTVQSRNQSAYFHNARDNFIPVIQKANEYGAYIFAHPWTAPKSMKSNNAIAGGYLSSGSTSSVDFADWLRGFLTWLNTNEAPIFAIGILNEPEHGGGAAYEGMGMNATQMNSWLRTVGHYTTQRVTNRVGAGETSSIFTDAIIPGYGGGAPTHHVLAAPGDSAGNVAQLYDTSIENSVSNNRIDLITRHYYYGSARYSNVVGDSGTAWANRPQLSFTGRFEAEALAESPQMFAPGTTAGNVKREVWQSEFDHNQNSNSTTIPAGNVQRNWNMAFAAMNSVDFCFRIQSESVYDWWFSSSWSGLVTSYQGAWSVGGSANPSQASGGGTPWPAYTITPRGFAWAHYARYINETWLLDIARTRGTIDFNPTSESYNAGSNVPRISAFEDTDGKFINIVMYTPNASTNSSGNPPTSSGAIGSGFGSGGLNGINDPTVLSTNVGRLEIVMPDGFTPSSAIAIRSYGWELADGQTWDTVPNGSPRYWIDEPVFITNNSVLVTLPGGNIISIHVKGEWSSSAAAGRHFEPRVRPYTPGVGPRIPLSPSTPINFVLN